MTGIYAINRTSMKKLSIFMFCHHQPWSIKQWDPTFKRPSVNYTQMFLLIVFLIEIFLTWNSGCNFSIKTFSQKEQKYWKLVFVHCWTWSDGDCLVELCLVLNANADWFPGLIWWTISPCLTVRALFQKLLLEFFCHDFKSGNCKEKYENKKQLEHL